MKSSVLHLALLLLALACSPTRSWAQANQAQPPGQISFQGFLTDANGTPLATNTPQNFNVFFNIYSGPNGGTPLWGEAQVVTVSQGYFTVLLGVGSAIPSSATFHTNDLTYLFSTNNAQTRYVGLTVSGVSSGELAPRLQMLSSPFSLLAANAVNANSASFATNAANAVHASNADNASAAVTSGTATNALNLDPNFKIQPSNLSASIGLWNVTGSSIFYNGGNVGIGVSSPSTSLQIGGAQKTDRLRLSGPGFGGGSDANNGVSLVLGLNNAGNRQLWLADSASVGVSNVSVLRAIMGSVGYSTLDSVSGDGSTYHNLAITPAGGNVGIGTTAPATKLDVNGNTTVRGTLTYVGSGTTLNPVGDADEKLRMVRGNLPTAIGQAANATASGPGWTATLLNGVAWQVTFTRSFSGVPTVVASFVQNNSNTYWGFNTVSGEVVSKATATGVILRADSSGSDSAGGNVTLGVGFIAVGL